MNFDKEYSESKNQKSQNNNCHKSYYFKDEYERIREVVARRQKENAAWEQEYSNLISLKKLAKLHEDNGALDQAIATYLEAIELGENSKQLGLNNYLFYLNRAIILYSKTRQFDNLKSFLKDKISKYSNSIHINAWIVRLSKLEKKEIDLSSIKPKDIVKQFPINPTLGHRINMYQGSMPEFNFFYDLPKGGNKKSYKKKLLSASILKLKEYQAAYNSIMRLAKIAEHGGDYKQAIEAYEKLVVEEIENPEPYDRLMILYSKLKWKEQEIELIQKAISFFTRIRDRQANYVISLADKYGMKQTALNYIDNDKKIFYYFKAFTLYDPYVSKLNNWKKRLEKLR